MKLARVAILGVAVGAGVVAALLALNMSGPESEPVVADAVAPIDTVEVLVVTKDIPMGSTVSDSDVAWQDWPENGASSRFIVRASEPDAVDQVVGSIARSTLYAGEPVSQAKLIRSDRGFMSAILPAGKRAVATKISADTSAGGFILPNDRVDVIMTRRDEQNPDAPGGYQTETVLNDVRVLAIDQTIEDVDGEKVVVGQTATLELTPQQAEILTVAQQMSDMLTLSLRSIADTETGPIGADAYHLIGGAKKNGGVTVVKNGVAREVSGIR
ncbi:MAG: Flp pilus assembly protein CpaB [Bauldia sp.]|nr:Flp pilus assembly protein CpaB [Bauldia sp.]